MWPSGPPVLWGFWQSNTLVFQGDRVDLDLGLAWSAPWPVFPAFKITHLTRLVLPSLAWKPNKHTDHHHHHPKKNKNKCFLFKSHKINLSAYPIFVYFEGYIWQCSGNPSWRGSKDRMGCWGWNPGEPHIRQVPYLLCYHSSPSASLPF